MLAARRLTGSRRKLARKSRKKRDAGPAAPVHLRAPAPVPVPHPRHAALDLALAGARRLRILPDCGGGKTDPLQGPSGQSVLVHGAASVVGSMATQLAREAGAYVIGTGRAAGRQTALDFGAQEFVDLDNDALEDVGRVDLVFDVLGGDCLQEPPAARNQYGGPGQLHPLVSG